MTDSLYKKMESRVIKFRTEHPELAAEADKVVREHPELFSFDGASVKVYDIPTPVITKEAGE